MSSIVCALWGLGICGGLLLLMALVALVWARKHLNETDIKSFFEKDK